ncbi:MAG: AraC family transcriptional regulator [Bacteroidota bacterium]
MNHLILWKDIRLFLGQNPMATSGHAHPVIQLVIAKEGEFKTLDPASGNWINQKGLLIQPNHQHQCDATDVPIFSLDIDPDTALGEWVLDQVLKERSVLTYPSARFGEIDFKKVDQLVVAEDWSGLYDYIKGVFQYEEKRTSHPKEERIAMVVEYIHDHIHELLTTEDLTEVSYLSESRLLHLFKAEMGLPIRSYILWYRLKVAMEKVIGGANLTEAAHAAGFSDQAHFTRTCRKMLGVPPSVLTSNSKFIQVNFSE